MSKTRIPLGAIKTYERSATHRRIELLYDGDRYPFQFVTVGELIEWLYVMGFDWETCESVHSQVRQWIVDEERDDSEDFAGCAAEPTGVGGRQRNPHDVDSQLFSDPDPASMKASDGLFFGYHGDQPFSWVAFVVGLVYAALLGMFVMWWKGIL